MNSSLCVTSASHLFQGGADEQLIISHTGHRSVEGVRNYKRESEEQKQLASTDLNSASNRQPVPYEVKVRKKRWWNGSERNTISLLSILSTQLQHLTPKLFNLNFLGCSSVITNNFKGPNWLHMSYDWTDICLLSHIIIYWYGTIMIMKYMQKTVLYSMCMYTVTIM